MTRLLRLRAVFLLLASALLLSGCGFNVYKLPLPGGTDVGDHPITVHVMFANVLDLVPQSTVKVNDVSVGKVTDITLTHDYTADVTIQLRGDTKLPHNAVAEIRQTSLLGEKFVSLAAPETGASTEPLGNGDIITLDRTGRNPEVEEVLGALSLLLNGGGVAQLKTISRELNAALTGREGAARSVLSQLRTFMTQLDDNKAAIVQAIESINRLSISVNKQRGTIDATLEQLPSALQSLDRQRGDLVRMLRALSRLSSVGTRVIRASKTATIDSLRQLFPVVSQLAAAKSDFANSFNVFLTYPFVDQVVGRDPQVARNLHMGDYTNLDVTLDLSLTGDQPGGPTTLPTNLPSVIDPSVIVDNVLKCLQSGDLSSKACQKVLNTPSDLSHLREECAKKKNRDKDVCKELNALPGLPGTSGTSLPTQLPTSDLPSLFRPATGDGGRVAPYGARGPTMGQLMKAYDPALVSLLVPGSVVR